MMTIASLAVAREGFKEVLTLASERFAGTYSQLCNSWSTRQEFERIKTVSGLPMAGPTPEGTPVNLYERRPGHVKDFYAIKYTAYVPISWETGFTDVYGKYRENGRLVAVSLEARRQRNFADTFFNNGFDSVNYPGPDGVSLYNTAHPFPGGVTGSNAPASNLALNSANLATCAQQLLGVQDAMGIYMPNPSGWWLVTGINRHFDAKNILRSPYTPNSANYDPAVQKELFEPFLVKEITSSTAWFAVPRAKDDHTFTMMTRMPRRTHSFMIDDRHTSVEGAYEEHVFFWRDWRNVWGTQGS
jgi:hypothetical protein